MLDLNDLFVSRSGFGGFRPHIVGIGGTTRIGSSSEIALRCTLSAMEAMGATTEVIVGPLLDLPMYDPSHEHRSPSARRLVQSCLLYTSPSPRDRS